MENEKDIKENTLPEVSPELQKLIDEQVKDALKNSKKPVNENIPSTPKIEVISDTPGLKVAFNKFMQDCALGNIKKEYSTVTNNVTIEVPKQFSPLIVAKEGQFGKLGDCYRAGDLVSDTFTFERTVSAGSTNWISKTQRSTNSLTGAVSANSTNVAVNFLDCWVTLYDYQLFSGGYDVDGFVKRNIDRQMPLAIDTQIFTGTGSPFVGIYGDSYVQTVVLPGVSSTNLNTFTLTSARAMVASIDPAYRNENLKWYVDMSEERYLTALADSNNTFAQIVDKYTKAFGFEIVPMSSGVLNTTSSPSGKHFVLANLKEAIQYADRPMQLEVFRTTGNAFDYRFFQPLALGSANPKAAVCITQAAA